MEWSNLILETIHSHSEKIVTRTGWHNRDESREALSKHLERKTQVGSRLVRYVIEQAAHNIAKAIVQISHTAGFGNQNYPADSEIPDFTPLICQQMLGYWPAVGIRIDYLIQGQAEQINRMLRSAQQGKVKREKAERAFYELTGDESGHSRKIHAMGNDEFEWNNQTDSDEFDYDDSQERDSSDW